MSTEIRMFCDRCGEQFNPRNRRIYAQIGHVKRVSYRRLIKITGCGAGSVNHDRTDTYDLCEDCARAFEAFMKRPEGREAP